MASLLEAMETECGNLSVKTRFEYATLEEANANIFDKLVNGDFPVCLVLPFNPVDTRANGKIISSAEITAIFLDRLNNEATIDKITKEIENQIIAPMRSLTREWINRLDENDIINEDGITETTHQSTHEGLGDAHLFGNWSTFSIKYEESLSTCPPD
jgi:hypothetical protein